MPFCTKCGSQVEPNAKICPKCSSSQSPETESGPENHNENGGQFFDNRRFEEALVEFDAAVRLDPDNLGYHFNKGMALNELTQYQETPEAETRYTKAAEAEFKIAIEGFKSKVNSDRNNTSYMYWIGRAFLELGKAKDALKYFDRAVVLEPENFHYHVQRSRALHFLEKYKEAIKELDLALGIEKGEVALIVLKAKLTAEVYGVENSVQILNDALKFVDEVSLLKEIERIATGPNTKLTKREREALIPFFYKEALGAARQMKPSELLL